MVRGEERLRADAGDPECPTDRQTWFYSGTQTRTLVSNTSDSLAKHIFVLAVKSVTCVPTGFTCVPTGSTASILHFLHRRIIHSSDKQLHLDYMSLAISHIALIMSHIASYSHV
jgi:hypothetical protein